MAAKPVREAEMKCLCPDPSTLGGFVLLAIEDQKRIRMAWKVGHVTDQGLESHVGIRGKT